MKLLYSKASPYARAVRICIQQLGLKKHVVLSECNPLEADSQFRVQNPLGKIPCLILDNGDSLYDSEVICEYLDTEYGDGHLFAAMRDNWQLRKYYSLINGLLDAAVARRMEHMRDKEGLKSDFWMNRFNEAINQGLGELERVNSDITENPSIITITLASLLGYLDFRHPDLPWREAHPVLSSWYSAEQEWLSDTQPVD